MKLSEYAAYDGLGLAKLVRDGEVTARELADTALRAIDQFEGEISALVSTFREEAEALPQDAKPEGTFGGVPLIIKDCVIMMEGKPLYDGSRLCAGLTAPYDSAMMKKFRAAGVTVVGLSKAPEFGYNANTAPVAFGPVHNPWRLDRSPGGSSGGSAASVAAGYVPIAHGTDGGGSIRIPASACGLVGLKTTRGRTPMGPDFGEALFGMASDGVLTRTVRDTAAMLQCISGPASGDPYVIAALPEDVVSALDTALKGLRIAVAPTPPWAPPPEPGIAELVAETGRLLASLGHHVEEDCPKFDVAGLSEAISTAWVVGETAWIRAMAHWAGREPGPDTLERTMWNIYREGMQLGAVEATGQILSGFNAACRSVGPFFDTFDFLVTPTLARLPLPIDYLDQNADLSSRQWWDRLFDYLPYTSLFNVTGQPAISLPLGQSADGLPIGVQIVGRYGDEARLLRLARSFELAKPWSDRVPPVSALRTSG